MVQRSHDQSCDYSVVLVSLGHLFEAGSDFGQIGPAVSDWWAGRFQAGRFRLGRFQPGRFLREVTVAVSVASRT
eukprot:6451817-Prymnesium_polylepis.1